MKGLIYVFVLSLALANAPLLAQGGVTPPSDQVGWWPGDDHALDLVSGTPGSLEGDAAYDDGQVGSAFAFDGGGDSVRTRLFASPADLPETTWEAWVYPAAVNGSRPILSTDDGGFDRDVRIASGEFVVFAGCQWATGLSPTINEWQHVAVTYTSDDVIFYLNGVKVNRGGPATGGSTSNPLTIGRNPGFNEFFDGRIDEVAVYERALTDAEIAAIVDAGSDGMIKPVLATTDLSVAVEVSPGVVWPGIDYTVTHTVRNEGAAATSPLLQVIIPPGVEFVASDGAMECVESGGGIECAVRELAPGEEATVTTTFGVGSGGEKSHEALVMATGALDDNSANDFATVAKEVRTLPVTAEDGDWAAQEAILENTSEAGLVVRVGDIDNLGFEWPVNFNPFSGESTPSHSFPWVVDPTDADGTDRIMVVSSYDGNPPCSQDGYTRTTSRPANEVRPIVLTYDPSGLAIDEAVVQMFVDDFQAGRWCADYTATINGRPAPFLANILNTLDQTGPVGKLITFQVPPIFLDEIATGQLAFGFDDLTTGAGDGFAIDFIKLLINPRTFAETGALSGAVRDDCTDEPVEGARVTAAGRTTTTDADGVYVFDNLAAGLLVVTVERNGYDPVSGSIDLVAGNAVALDLAMSPRPLLRIVKGQGASVDLFWEVCPSDWSLHTSTDLVNWNPVLDAPDTEIRPGFNSIEHDVDETPRAFFQLQR